MEHYPHGVEISRAPIVEGYGGQRVRDWSQSTTWTAKARVTPVSSLEDYVGRDTVVTRYRFRTSTSTVIDTSDRITWRGKVLEIDGDIEEWRPERPKQGHLACFLRQAVDR